MNTHIAATEPVPEDEWIKSSYSDGTGNSCVEVTKPAAGRVAVGVRDSKDRCGPALAVPPAGWAVFVGFVRDGQALVP